MATDAAALPHERRAVLLISSAHAVSHLYALMLIPLFPLLKTQLDVGFVQLGLAITIFNVVSVLTQTPAGVLVDRIGARKLLVAGLLLGGLAFALFAAVPTFPMLILATVLLGLANSVYHPADYEMLSATVAPSRAGRAFSYHTFSGYVGFAVAPPLMLWLSTSFGLSAALGAGALIGAVVALPLLFAGDLDARAPLITVSDAAPVNLRALLTPAILSLTFFFVFLSLSTSGIQNFSIPALMSLHGLSQALANAALTAFLVGVAFGVLGGGLIADKTARHEDVAAAGYVACAAMTFAIGAFNAGTVVTVGLMGAAGFCSGLIMPSRDMLVRKAAPAGAVGRTFGIVTTGLNIGGTIGPLAFGWLMDRGLPRDIYFAAAVLMLVTAFVPLLSTWMRRRSSPPMRAARV
jgi:FSR family fosmidomycin resistance protein-like MFS transporter